MEPTQDNNAKGLAPWEFGTWVLANFSTVDEVNAAIARIALVPTYLNTLKEVPPAHYKIQDAKGHCIVGSLLTASSRSMTIQCGRWLTLRNFPGI